MGAVGIIFAGGDTEDLKEITKHRSISAAPVGGNYRAIDFSLSNMSNSGIKKIGVITQYNSRSLKDHLTSEKWWDLGRKNGGLYVFTPYLTENNPYWYRGTADGIYQNLTFLRKSTEDYVVLAFGDHIYNIDFTEILEYHKEKRSDITVVYKNINQEDLYSFGSLTLGEDQRVLDYEAKTIGSILNPSAIGIYIISRTLLMRLVHIAVAQEQFDFISDIIIGNKDKLKIFGYEYVGYWSPIRSVEAYYKVNMDFLNERVQGELLNHKRPIYTKIKDEPPAKYNNEAMVKNSIVPCGCIIDSTVENSVLFRSVRIGRNTIVRNSIIMEGTYIGNNCIVENAIVDKYVVVSDGNKIIGSVKEPRILPKEMVV